MPRLRNAALEEELKEEKNERKSRPSENLPLLPTEAPPLLLRALIIYISSNRKFNYFYILAFLLNMA